MKPVNVYKNKKYKNKIQESYQALLDQWNCHTTDIYIEGRYGTTHVIECGSLDKMPLLLFHGVGDDAALMWVYNAKELGEHFHIYAVDTLGGPGKSTPGTGYGKDFEDVTWIDEILDYLKIDSAHFAGVSNGSSIIQMYAVERPNRVIKAISMAGGPSIKPKDASNNNAKSRAMLTMMKVFLPEALLPTDKNVKKLIRKMTGDNYQAFTENEKVFEHFKNLMVGFNRAAMMSHKVKAYSESELLAIKDKILYIVGNRDPFMMMGGLDLFKQYPFNVVVLEGAGHGINHEKAQEINKLIVEFFS